MSILTKLSDKWPVWPFLVFLFLTCSWPFIHYPMTDGDVANWTDAANYVRVTGEFLKGMNDQGHGPLLAWTAGIFTKLSPHTYYLYNLFNLLMGMWGVWIAWWWSDKLWKDEAISRLTTMVFSTTIATIYLTRTPLYDWPAAIALFTFAACYWVAIKEGRLGLLFAGLVAIGIGSLSRFSICLGLSGIYMLGVSWIERRTIFQVFRDGILIIAAIATFNMPWLLGQIQAHGGDFLTTFIYDNTGRYVKSTRPNSTYRADWYGFTIYAILGMLPYSFAMVKAFFKRQFLRDLKTNKRYQVLLMGVLPCLILFSFSGHTKLFRYIAYLFPFLSLLVGHLLNDVLRDAQFRTSLRRVMLVGVGMLTVLMGIIMAQNSGDAIEGIATTISLCGLLVGILVLGYRMMIPDWELFLARPQRYLIGFALLYMATYSVITIDSFSAEFLSNTRKRINRSIENPFYQHDPLAHRRKTEVAH